MIKTFLNSVAVLMISLTVSVAVMLVLAGVRALLTEYGLTWVWNLAAAMVVARVIYLGIRSIRKRSG